MKLSKLGKRGQSSTGFVNLVIAGVAVLLLLNLAGVNTNFFGGTQSAAGGVSAGGGGTTILKVEGDKACASTTVSLPNTNALARGTAPDQYTRLFLNNEKRRVDKGQIADAGTITLTGGDHFIAYHAENSTTAQTGYYTDKRETTLPCTGATSAYTDEGQLYQYDNAMTLSYKNQDGSVNTGQSIAANSEYNIDVTIRSSSQKTWGNPQLVGKATNALCFKYNNTVITSLDWKIGGVNQPVIAVPQIHAGNNSDVGENNAFRCFGAPVIKNTEKLEGVLNIKSGSTAATAVNTINVTTEDMDYDLNADDLSEIIGVQDEDGNDLGFRGHYLRPIDLTA